MKREYNHEDVDKTKWGNGPWVTEADKIVWVDEATDLDCMIHRNRGGALCGYVGVPSTHPWYGKHYDSIDPEVHGGLTYTDKCQESASEDNGVCHVPEPGREHDIWWVGFDCAHGMDVVPGFEALPSITKSISELNDTIDTLVSGGNTWASPTYKTVEWVTDEVERLAAQAKEAA